MSLRRVEVGFCLVDPPDEEAALDIVRGPGDLFAYDTEQRLSTVPSNHIGVSANSGTFTA
jgi:hypothetical protein